MYFILDKRRLFFSIVIFLIAIKSTDTELAEEDYRPSSVELIPSSVIVNSSSSIVQFLCINHESDDLPLMIELSKNISSDQIKLFRYQLNKTMIDIRIQLKNYLGIFQLICYSKNSKTKGISADVIVTTEPGSIVLSKQCQVYERKYIKCTFRAPTIARAIQNDFPIDFEFTEYTNLQAYSFEYEFLENESMNDDLVFKWIPNVDGQFPDGVLMNISVKSQHFRNLSYHFNMTPVFVIKPNFQLKKLTKNQIQIQLTPIFPPAMCVKRLKPKLNSNITRRWTKFDATRNTTIIGNLSFDTIYQICIRCRERSNDRYEITECQEIRTSEKTYCQIIIIVIVIISCISLCLIIALIYHFHYNPRTSDYQSAVPGDDLIDETDQDSNMPVDSTDDLAGYELTTFSPYQKLFYHNST